MDAGKRDIRVVIQQLDPSVDFQDLDRDDDGSWIDVGERWAQFMSKGSREFYRAQQVQADLSELVRMHSDSVTRAITADMRLKVKSTGEKFQVISKPQDIDRQRKVVEVQCRG